jgi:PAP2 superfamily
MEKRHEGRGAADKAESLAGCKSPYRHERLKTMALGERPDALGEIHGQCKEFTSYFGALMGATPITHPATFLLFAIANPIATMTVMFFKDRFDWPRPSHICPALYPPLQVPGHASYPSGHSTQAHLLALCATAVLDRLRRIVREQSAFGAWPMA